MKIEIGKYYLTRHGKRVGPMAINHEDPSSYGHFRSPHEKWMTFSPMWHSDGLFWPNQERDNDLIAEWTDATPGPADIEWGPWGEMRHNVFPRQSQNIDGKETLWRYPVQKQPVVETVTLVGGQEAGVYQRWDFTDADVSTSDTHKITLTIIDGVVQPTATVEAL